VKQENYENLFTEQDCLRKATSFDSLHRRYCTF